MNAKNTDKKAAFIRKNVRSSNFVSVVNSMIFKKIEINMSLIKIRNIILLLSLFVFGSSLVQAQSADTLTIKGQVINSSNEPVANVSVAIEGSSELPSLTNEKGEFSIKTSYGYKWLNIEPS